MRSSTFRLPLVLLAAALSTPACSDGPTGPDPTLAGRWEGFVEPPDTGPFFLEMIVDEADGTASGSGLMRVGEQVLFEFAVDGTRSGSSFSLGLTPDGFEPFVYVGRVGAGTLEGRMDGSGLDDVEVVLTRPEG